MGASFTTIYWLDFADHITRVSDSWDTFALSNQGEESRWARVHGRRLWEFVSGDATRMWIHAVLAHVRSSGGELERPYRCDSPEERRHMAMRVVAEERGVVRLEHTVLRSEPRNHAVRFEPHLRVGGYSSRRCSICGRIARGERWLEPDTEEARELTELNGAIRVIYGVCEPCRSMVPRASPAAI